jgi:hypothetical protein
MVERVLGRLHISTYCAQEAVREYCAWMSGEPFRFIVPQTDADGYLIGAPYDGWRPLPEPSRHPPSVIG